MVENTGKNAASEYLEYVGKSIPEIPVNMLHGVVGGVMDATALNIMDTVRESWTGSATGVDGPIKSAVNVITQPIAGTVEAAKELVTLHPFRAGTRIVIAANQGIENGLNVVTSTVDLADAATKRALRGVSRTTVGLMGEDITDEHYKKIVDLGPPQAFGGTQPPANNSYFYPKAA